MMRYCIIMNLDGSQGNVAAVRCDSFVSVEHIIQNIAVNQTGFPPFQSFDMILLDFFADSLDDFLQRSAVECKLQIVLLEARDSGSYIFTDCICQYLNLRSISPSCIYRADFFIFTFLIIVQPRMNAAYARTTIRIDFNNALFS